MSRFGRPAVWFRFTLSCAKEPFTHSFQEGVVTFVKTLRDECHSFVWIPCHISCSVNQVHVSAFNRPNEASSHIVKNVTRYSMNAERFTPYWIWRHVFGMRVLHLTEGYVFLCMSVYSNSHGTIFVPQKMQFWAHYAVIQFWCRLVTQLHSCPISIANWTSVTHKVASGGNKIVSSRDVLKIAENCIFCGRKKVPRYLEWTFIITAVTCQRNCANIQQ